jgi:hypothetical protein
MDDEMWMVEDLREDWGTARMVCEMLDTGFWGVWHGLIPLRGSDAYGYYRSGRYG